jgi:isocitrate dehydrogenase
MFDHIAVPKDGSKIHFDSENNLVVPNNPIIPFIQGDGIGLDITPVMQNVVNQAVKKAYNGEKQIHWMEVYAGDKAVEKYGKHNYLPQETFDAIEKFVVAIKGPLTTPVGEGPFIATTNFSIASNVS